MVFNIFDLFRHRDSGDVAEVLFGAFVCGGLGELEKEGEKR
jgi:hypothetical protein